MTRITRQHSDLYGQRWYAWKSGEIQEIQNAPYLVWEKNCVKSDIVVHHLNQGWRDPGPYELEDYTYDAPQGLAIRTSTSKPGVTGYDYTETLAGNLGLFFTVRRMTTNMLPYAPERMRTIVETKALLKLKDSKVNLALSIREAKMTADLIRDRALALYRSYKALRAGKVADAWKEIGLHPGNRGKRPAKSVLEIQYGWRPLMSDIYGGVESIRKGIADQGLLIKATARTEAKDSPGMSYGYDSVWNVMPVRAKLTRVQRVQCTLWARVDNEYLAKATELGFGNPAEIVWEGTTASFLVDWILPIGDFLSALDAPSGLSFVSGTFTQSVHAHLQQWWEDGKAVGGGGNSNETYTCNAKSSETGFYMKREVYKTFPLPHLYFKSPFSFEHAINAIALFRGKVKL